MSCTAIPHRKPRQAMSPIGRAVIGEPIEPIVEDVIRRLRSIRHTTQAGAYVLADDQGNVYVLKEIAPTNAKIIKPLGSWLVGLYANEDRPVYPLPHELHAAIVSTFFRSGYLKLGMIYGQVAHSDH